MKDVSTANLKFRLHNRIGIIMLLVLMSTFLIIPVSAVVETKIDGYTFSKDLDNWDILDYTRQTCYNFTNGLANMTSYIDLSDLTFTNESMDHYISLYWLNTVDTYYGIYVLVTMGTDGTYVGNSAVFNTYVNGTVETELITAYNASFIEIRYTGSLMSFWVNSEKIYEYSATGTYYRFEITTSDNLGAGYPSQFTGTAMFYMGLINNSKIPRMILNELITVVVVFAVISFAIGAITIKKR